MNTLKSLMESSLSTITEGQFQYNQPHMSGPMVDTATEISSEHAGRGGSFWLSLNNLSSYQYDSLVKGHTDNKGNLTQDPLMIGYSVRLPPHGNSRRPSVVINPRIVDGIAGGPAGKDHAVDTVNEEFLESLVTAKSTPVVFATHTTPSKTLKIVPGSSGNLISPAQKARTEIANVSNPSYSNLNNKDGSISGPITPNGSNTPSAPSLPDLNDSSYLSSGGLTGTSDLPPLNSTTLRDMFSTPFSLGDMLPNSAPSLSKVPGAKKDFTKGPNGTIYSNIQQSSKTQKPLNDAAKNAAVTIPRVDVHRGGNGNGVATGTSISIEPKSFDQVFSTISF